MKTNNNTDIAFASCIQKVFLKLERDHKLSTYKNYKYSLSVFYKYIDMLSNGKDWVVSPHLFSEEILQGFVKWMREQRQATSCNTVLANIRGLLKRIQTEDPTFVAIYLGSEEVEKMKEEKREVLPLNENEIRKILEATDLKSPMGIRYNAMFSLIVTSGLRISEALSIRMKDITLDGARSHIRIIGKGKKPRDVPISVTMIPILTNYMVYFHLSFDMPEAYLFFSTRTGFYRMASRSGAHIQLKHYAKKALGEDGKSVHLHQLRHTAATSWLENGVILPDISKILGHSSLHVTKRYAKVSMKMKDAAMKENQTPQKQPREKENILDFLSL